MATVVEQAPAWVMPKPKRGNVVLYYPGRSKSKRYNEIAWVCAVKDQSLVLSVNGVKAETVLHKDDPRLLKNPDLYKDISGTWEAIDEGSEDDFKLEGRVKKLEATVKELAGKLKSLGLE